MNYCPVCRKLTADRLDKKAWGTTKFMVYAHCRVCNTYKYRYLETKMEVEDEPE